MQQNSPASDTPPVPPSERSHWVAFAAILLMLSGLFDLINGFVALLDHGYYATTANHGNRLLIFNFSAWGWVWIIIGVAQVLASLGVLLGVRAARIAGIALAALCLIGQLMFLSAFPYWSIFVMAMSLLVIYGLVREPRHVPGARV
ncbi:hypothetical protein [Streptomyces sp. NPDC058773]|uniref:DUF7144 family membrane protein n=1 Tax=Streptomyces sp. NPDC058773 TaxID=3346632 RepID=UPI0036A248ED